MFDTFFTFLEPACHTDLNGLMKSHNVIMFLVLEPVFTMSKFGRPVIEIGEYRFNKYHRSTNKGRSSVWTCSKARSSGCRATLRTVDNMIVMANNQHSHKL